MLKDSLRLLLSSFEKMMCFSFHPTSLTLILSNQRNLKNTCVFLSFETSIGTMFVSQLIQTSNFVSVKCMIGFWSHLRFSVSLLFSGLTCNATL